MSAFTSAMDRMYVQQTFNEKGEVSLGPKCNQVNPLVRLFFKLVRNLSKENLLTLLREVLEHSKKCGADTDVSILEDLCVLTLQTRDIRGGKGERKLVFDMIPVLHSQFPHFVRTSMLPMLGGVFGCWGDLVKLHIDIEALLVKNKEDDIMSDNISVSGNDSLQETEALLQSIRDVLVSRLLADCKLSVKKVAASGEKVDTGFVIVENVDQLGKNDVVKKKKKNGGKGPSLVAKWLPREHGNRSSKRLARLLAMQSFPEAADAKTAFRLYRKSIAQLNTLLGVIEVKMCGKRWKEINPAHVPGRCLKKHRKAFFNIGKRGVLKDEDREICAKNFQKHIAKALKGETKVHGRTLFAHELVKEYMCNNGGGMDAVIEAQWIDLRKQFLELFNNSDSKCTLGKYVALSDVSGSMQGIPMQVSIALGILISELTMPEFRDRFITFHETPTWHVLPSTSKGASLYDKVRSAMRASWGGTTNFEHALNLILETAVRAKISPENMPEGLIVLSDMQFDIARGNGYYRSGKSGDDDSWESNYTRISAAFRRAGYTCPRIVFWNLRGNTKDFPVRSDQPGTDMISGFSQNLLKQFMDGSLLGKNPLDTLRILLSDARYEPVRKGFRSSLEVKKSEVNRKTKELSQRHRDAVLAYNMRNT